MNILVLNTGSSSLKFQIIDSDMAKIEASEDKQLAKGIIERIGSQAVLTFEVPGQPKRKESMLIKDHKEAIQQIINWITADSTTIEGISSLQDIHAIGHRTVHGGEKFNGSIAISQDVISMIEECIDLAPLHNPANLKGLYAA